MAQRKTTSLVAAEIAKKRVRVTAERVRVTASLETAITDINMALRELRNRLLPATAAPPVAPEPNRMNIRN